MEKIEELLKTEEITKWDLKNIASSINVQDIEEYMGKNFSSEEISLFNKYYNIFINDRYKFYREWGLQGFSDMSNEYARTVVCMAALVMVHKEKRNDKILCLF